MSEEAHSPAWTVGLRRVVVIPGDSARTTHFGRGFGLAKQVAEMYNGSVEGLEKRSVWHFGISLLGRTRQQEIGFQGRYTDIQCFAGHEKQIGERCIHLAPANGLNQMLYQKAPEIRLALRKPGPTRQANRLHLSI
jgi:hypothetical protein